MASDKNSIILTAQRFTAKGEIDKAIEVWKSLIAETPNDGNIYNTVGDLYLKKSAHTQAIEAFLRAGTTFQAAGFALKTIAVYKKIIKLDPSRMDVVLKLAEVNAERGIVGNAVEDYLKVARHELKEGRAKAAIDVYRKIAALDPSNPTIGLKLADLCQKEGLIDEAREELQRVAGHLESAGKTSELKQIQAKLRELVGGTPETELTAAGRSASAEIVLEPTSHSEAPVDRSGGSINEATAMAEAEPPRGGEVPRIAEPKPLKKPAMPPPPSSVAVPVVSETARLKTPSEFDETTHERLTDALTEADVYVKYGMLDKAVAHVQAMAERDPTNIDIQMKLKDLFLTQGDAQSAADVCVKIASIYEHLGQEAEREVMLREAATINPEHSNARSPAASQPAEPSPIAAERSVREGEELPVPTTDRVVGGEAEPSPADALEQDLAEADFYFQQGFDDEARRLFATILKKSPDHPVASQRLREIAARAGSAADPIDAEATSQNLNAPMNESSLGSEIAVNGRKSTAENDNEASLGQEIAVNRRKPVVESNQPNESTKQEEYIDLVDALREDMERSVPPPEEAELSQELSAERELENVFRKFQKGVLEQYGAEDYETHYNLGIAYREMGLLNEAIGEFRLVLKSPERFIPATSMLATCYREKGALPRAEEILREVLDDPAHKRTEGIAGLAYELGQIFEVQGRVDDALTQYYRARELEPTHKEVGSRITHLERRAATGGPPTTAPFSIPGSKPKGGATRPPAAQPIRPQKKKVSYL